MPALSSGVVSSHLLRGLCPPDDLAVLRVLGLKLLKENKYRLAVTDVPEGESSERFNAALIIRGNQQILPERNDVVDFASGDAEDPNRMQDIGDRTIWVIRHYRILDGRVQTPSTPSTSVTKASAPSITATNGSTPSTSASNGSVTPPRPPVKRSSTDAMTPVTPSTSFSHSNGGVGNVNGSTAKRSLVFEPSSSQATHKIKDLSPYQNKYTVLAQVTEKSDMRAWSNSRGDGTVFNVTLQDESGDIKATGFNEFAKKFHSMLEVGKMYFVSHAQVRAKSNPKFNSTSHNYELSLNQNTMICECRSSQSVPKTLYNFTSIPDIDRKSDGDKVDVLAVCTLAQDVREVTTKTGRQVKKRDLTLADQSGSEIRITLWAEKAECFQATGRVVAFRAATVSDYNGKSLSLSFGGSLEVDPDIPEATTLTSWYSNSQHKPLSRTGRREDSGDFLSIAEIKSNFMETCPDQAKYYDVDAYVTLIQNSDNVTYMACPFDNCNKKLVDEGAGSFYCNKCRRTTSTFTHRYMLRGTIADTTDFTYFTAFDDAASQIVGSGAAELMQLKDLDVSGYRRKIAAGQFCRYKFRVSCKREVYNDESRIKVTAVSAERINHGEQAHVDRIRRQIDMLKI